MIGTQPRCIHDRAGFRKPLKLRRKSLNQRHIICALGSSENGRFSKAAGRDPSIWAGVCVASVTCTIVCGSPGVSRQGLVFGVQKWLLLFAFSAQRQDRHGSKTQGNQRFDFGSALSRVSAKGADFRRHTDRSTIASGSSRACVV